MPMAAAALERVASWGPARIARTLGRLTSMIAGRARDLGLDVADPPARGPHMLGLRRAAGFSPDLGARLASRGVYVSVRGDSVRVSPHLYNDEEDVHRLVAALRDLI